MANKFMQNCRKPEGLGGKLMLAGMNVGHADVSVWGLSRLRIPGNARVLDIGCGGGANIKRLLAMCPQGHVEGIDHSQQSVVVSRKKNRADLGKRCEIRQGSVSALPYGDGAFDAVTAFETIYFWPDIAGDFREVHRVLKPGGSFLICNEACDPADETWTGKIDGMRVYGREELFRLFADAGLSVTLADEQGKGRLCVIAVKKTTLGAHAGGDTRM